MKPRCEETSAEVEEMLRKAQILESKIDALEKAQDCPSCGMKKMDCVKKYGSASACADMKKGEHHKATSFSTEPENAQFMIETGGQTYHQGYQTNQSLLQSSDVANNGATSSSFNMDSLSSKMNTHDLNTGRVITSGE